MVLSRVVLTDEPGFARVGGVCHVHGALPARAFAVSVAAATPPSVFAPARSRGASAHRDHRRVWLIAGGAALAVVGAILLWNAVKYDFIPKRFGVVEPGGLYRSGQMSEAMFAPTLREYDIDTVICLMGNDREDPDHVAEVAALKTMPDVKFERYPLRGDGTGDFEVYSAALASLVAARRADRTVLVHCSAGAQRTGSLVAAYRLLVKRDDPCRVYADLGRYGWEPEDAAMLDYLNQHLPESAERLYERGLLSDMPNPVPVLGP